MKLQTSQKSAYLMKYLAASDGVNKIGPRYLNVKWFYQGIRFSHKCHPSLGNQGASSQLLNISIAY